MDTTRKLFFFESIIYAAALLTSPPIIIQQPKLGEMLIEVAQPDEVDKPFKLECEAEGEPEPEFRWTKNGKPFEYTSFNIRNSEQSGRGTLVFYRPRDEDVGLYQCFAYNEWGTAASNSVFVRRAERITFNESDIEQVVKAEEGKPFKLTCDPPNGYPKPKVYWMLQGRQGQLTTINNARITLDPEGNLWFSNVTRSDASVEYAYVCTANSLFWNEYTFGKRIHLEVKQTGIEPTMNRQEPVCQYTTETVKTTLRGKMLELFCIYGGTPLPEVIWKINLRSIFSIRGVTLDNSNKTLVIRNPTDEHRGTYTCEVSNGVGTVNVHSILLIIEVAPFFTVWPEVQNVAVGETAEINCKAGGIPVPKIKWIHNGMPIEQAEANPRRQVTTNSIVITDVVMKDTGNYGCNVTSSIGYVYKEVFIRVLLSPIPVSTEAPGADPALKKDEKEGDSKSTKESTTTNIIMSICGAVLILLVFSIAIWKRCWIKKKPLGTRLPTTAASHPFYLNLLFRRECDAEIEEIEQHRYEEIERPYSDGFPIYEEIDTQEHVT